MAMTPDQQPAAVSEPVATPATTIQAGSIRDRWSWVEPAAWTERMLTALEKGVKGGVWFSLMDKVYSAANMEAAWVSVRVNEGAAGVDHVSVQQFQQRLYANRDRLCAELQSGSYVPQDIRRKW